VLAELARDEPMEPARSVTARRQLTLGCRRRQRGPDDGELAGRRGRRTGSCEPSAHRNL